MTLSFFLVFSRDLKRALRDEGRFHLFQTGFDRGVQHLVAHHDANATDQRVIRLHSEIQLAAKALFQRSAQLGQRLRVLVDKELAEPVAWLQQACPALAGASLALVRPSLEDVFVSCTGQEPRA